MKKSSQAKLHDWESLCARCGRCCYEKVDFEGRIYYTALPCEFLDLATNTCRVYDDRELKRPGCVCLTPENIKKGFLPGDCPYVVGLENYTPPSMSDDE